MTPKARMPDPTSRAIDARAITETGPPVSGRDEALAEAEAVGLAVVLELTSGRSLAWQPSGVSLGEVGSGQGSAETDALARVLNTNEQRVYSVLRGERGISDDLAIRLGRLFDIEPEFFANLQAHYDLEMKKMEIGHQVEDEVKPLAPAREVLTPR